MGALCCSNVDASSKEEDTKEKRVVRFTLSGDTGHYKTGTSSFGDAMPDCNHSELPNIGDVTNKMTTDPMVLNSARLPDLPDDKKGMKPRVGVPSADNIYRRGTHTQDIRSGQHTQQNSGTIGDTMTIRISS